MEKAKGRITEGRQMNTLFIHTMPNTLHLETEM